ncbi:hypothetical protein MRX96_026070 [Rhipicephalus microplus]
MRSAFVPSTSHFVPIPGTSVILRLVAIKRCPPEIPARGLSAGKRGTARPLKGCVSERGNYGRGCSRRWWQRRDALCAVAPRTMLGAPPNADTNTLSALARTHTLMYGPHSGKKGGG